MHWQVGCGGADIRGSLGLIYRGFMHIYMYIKCIYIIRFCKENKILIGIFSLFKFEKE